jgi:hypothetical protein
MRKCDVPPATVFGGSSQNLFVIFPAFNPLLGVSVGVSGQLI